MHHTSGLSPALAYNPFLGQFKVLMLTLKALNVLQSGFLKDHYIHSQSEVTLLQVLLNNEVSWWSLDRAF